MDEAEYFDYIRGGCADEETFQQEYMCVPSDDASAFLSYELIDACKYKPGEKWELTLDELRQCKDDTISVESRKHSSYIGRKSCAQSGNGTGDADGKNHPAVKKRNKIAVGLPNVDILPSGLGKHSSHFSESKSRKQSDCQADDPDSQKKPGESCARGDVFGGKKDAGADDPAGQQQDRIGKRESAN